MNIKTTFGVSCALAIIILIAAFEVLRDLFMNDLLTSTEPVAASLGRIVAAGMLTFIVTSFAWNLVVRRRLRAIVEQIGAIKPGARRQPEDLLQSDEFSGVLDACYDLSARHAAAVSPKAESALASLSLAGQGILRRTALAAEHISSLLLILRIANEYNQPVPGGAIHNLTLVEKDLRSLHEDFDSQFLHHASAAPGSLEPRISEDVPVSLPRDWTQEDRHGRFQASRLQVFPANVDRTAKT
jgi:hypothetical protein